MSDALWALIGVIVGGTITGIFNYFLQNSQFKHNKEMFLLKNQSKENVKEILIDMLWHKTHINRLFTTLSNRIGGYTDKEIRQMLHEVGAIKWIRQDDGAELWYLKERADERIERRNASNT